MNQPLTILQWIGWSIILLLCIIVGILWTRLDRQVDSHQAEIERLKAHNDSQVTEARLQAVENSHAVERRWRENLGPVKDLLRQHHQALTTVAPGRMPPLPEWLQEKP